MSSGIIAPAVRFHQWDVTEVDPGPNRHQEGSAFAFVKTLGTGCASGLNFGEITLDSTISQPFVFSDVIAVNFVFPDIFVSGFTTSNFRLWLPDGSGTALGAGSLLQFAASGAWIQDPAFASGQGAELPTVLPAGPNIMRVDGATFINGFGSNQASEFIYLRLFLDADHPTGSLGICGPSGIFRVRLTYDFYL